MSDDEDDLIDLDEAWESPPMSPHEKALWGGRESVVNSKMFSPPERMLRLTVRLDPSSMSPDGSRGKC